MSLNPSPSINTVTPTSVPPASPAPSASPPSSSPSGLAQKIVNAMNGPSLGDKLIETAKNLISPPINGKRSGNSGFTYITISGTPQERGFSHGKLIGDKIITFFRTYAFFMWTETGRDVRFFMKMLNDFFKPIVEQKYKECYDEMKGIADGVVAYVKENPDLKDHDRGAIIKDGKIILPKDSYINIENSNTKEGYTDGTILIDINVDIIFLLNNIVSVDYLYSKLPGLVLKRNDLRNDKIYAEFFPIKKTTATPSVKGGGGDSDNTEEELDGGEISGFEQSEQGGGRTFKELFFGGDKCSAFMAVGKSFTENGEVVCAHITFDNFITGQFDSIILYIDNSSSAPSSTTPQQPSPNSILMQTFPGGIWSSTDFFVTSAGFVGTETTIGGFHAFEANAPICVRARKAMEYSKTLDDYEKYFKENNSGDYASTWYIAKMGNTETAAIPSPSPSPTTAATAATATATTTVTPKSEDEIMRIELGLKYVHVERVTDGYFIGFNACYDARIRNLECYNDGFYDIRRHSGARRVRLEQLIQKYKGRINAQIAKLIISDHMDVYTNTELKCSRTVCAHYELDKREYMSQESRPKPFQPRGAVDAKICTSSLCRNMKFLARWGNACGTPFKKTEFCDKNIQWKYQLDFLEDRERQPWVFCSSVNMKEPVEKIDKAIEPDTDKTGYDNDTGSGSGSITMSSSPPRSPVNMASSKPRPVSPVSPVSRSIFKSTPSPRYRKETKPRIVNPGVTMPQQQPQLPQQPQPSHTQQQHSHEPRNLHSEHKYDAHQHNLLTGSRGGSFASDNTKEMKEFMKMLKTKNGSKSKAKNTRRHKHNKSKKDQ